MRAVVVVALLCGLVGVAGAEPALDKPSFTASATELLALAKSKPPGTTDVFILREEEQVTFDDARRSTQRWHRIYVVTSQAGIAAWDELVAAWSPAYQDKPTLRVRVIDPAGTARDIDVSRATEQPIQNSIRRRVELDLSPIAVGSIVEQEVITSDREPLLGGGDVETLYANVPVPIVSLRMSIDAPAKLRLHTAAQGMPNRPTRETKNGRQIVTYVASNLPAITDPERNLPPTDTDAPYIGVSAGESWAAATRAYRTAFEKRLGEVAFPAAVPKAATLDGANAILAWLQRTVRREDIELHDSSLLPTPPADVLKRGSGDVISRAALLCQLLRQAGLEANLALVSTSVSDFPNDLVSLDVFDHAIVHAKISGKDVWIDPDELGARAGQLAPFVASRQALVIADGTAALVRTPGSSAQDNVSRETRTYALQEWGAAKLTEVSTGSGAFEIFNRDWIRDTAPDQVRKDLQEYVASKYRDAKLDSYSTSAPADDLTKPFEVTLAVSNSRRGITARDAADVYLFPADMLSHLPPELGNPDEHPTLRKHDFVLRAPYREEIVNRIVAPPGFDLPDPIATKTRMLGALQLVEEQRRDGQAFIVTWKLDISKARLTPAEVAATQQATHALRREDGEHFVFDQSGFALEGKGKYREALAEMQRVIKLHPGEALHQTQLATILLHMGAGEAARRAAKRATELEPKSADAFMMYGWVLSHDSFGKWHGFDYDRGAVRAAYEAARKLDPKLGVAAEEQAKLLERGPHGSLYENAADTAGAIRAWRAALDDDPTNEDVAAPLIRALLYTGNAADAEAIATRLAATDLRNELLVAAVAIGKAGPQAAIATASSLASGDARTKLLQGAAAQLMMTRHYDEMRACYAAAPFVNAQLATMAQVMKRHDALKPSNDPEDVARLLLVALVNDDYTGIIRGDKELVDELRETQTKILTRMATSQTFPRTVLEDMLLSAATMKTDRADGIARVEMQQMGVKSHLYMSLGKGGTRLVGVSTTPKALGRFLLSRLASGDEKTAATLLDWLADDLLRVSPATGKALRVVWGANLPRNKEAMELASAVVASEREPRTLPIFKRCGATTTNGQVVCDVFLSEAYFFAHNWSELAEFAEAWAARAKSPLASAMRVRALAFLGRGDDAEQILGEALKLYPDDHRLRGLQVDVAWSRGQTSLAIQRGDALVALPDANGADLNNVAWSKLIEGSDLPNASVLAKRALALEPKSTNVLNTVAAIEAEQGEVASAREHLDAGRDAAEPPSSGDWYVHGRILDSLGLVDDAVAAYRKVKPSPQLTPQSAELAGRRLKALGARP